MKNILASAIIIFLTIFYPAHGDTKTDALDVKGKAVVFFGPTQQEYNSLSAVKKKQANEALDDFNHYCKNVIPFLESNNIQPISTSTMRIKIQFAPTKNIIYTRKEFQQYIGYILTDGNKEPKVIFGVLTDIELIEAFKEYFNIK